MTTFKCYKLECYFNRTHRCDATEYKYCPDKCVFYKTQEQFAADRRKATYLLERLPFDRLVELRNKYHNPMKKKGTKRCQPRHTGRN